MGNKLERNSFYILIVKVLTSKSYLIDNKFPSFSAPKSYLRKGYEKNLILITRKHKTISAVLKHQQIQLVVKYYYNSIKLEHCPYFK